MSEEKQNGNRSEAYLNMLNNLFAFAGQTKTMEPLVQLTKVQQQQYLNLSKAWVDHLWKIGEASRLGDVKKVMAKCTESNKDFLAVCQESLKEQATARYELWRTLIPAARKSTDAGA
ncbi:MAG: hypothetical protein WCO89_10110 [Syntrophus sp. (in: bacteria)]